MVVYTEKMPMMTLAWALLWICHYLWTVYLSYVNSCTEQACMEHELLTRQIKKMQRNQNKLIHKYIRMKQKFKQLEQDLLERNRIQYEHFTQLIDHVRADMVE